MGIAKQLQLVALTGTYRYIRLKSSNSLLKCYKGVFICLQFTWHSIPEKERARHKHSAEPVYSPTMAGIKMLYS